MFVTALNTIHHKIADWINMQHQWLRVIYYVLIHIMLVLHLHTYIHQLSLISSNGFRISCSHPVRWTFIDLPSHLLCVCQQWRVLTFNWCSTFREMGSHQKYLSISTSAKQATFSSVLVNLFVSIVTWKLLKWSSQKSVERRATEKTIGFCWQSGSRYVRTRVSGELWLWLGGGWEILYNTGCLPGI